MSLPLLKPLLLTVGATSLVFFGGVIALAIESPTSINSSSAPMASASSLINQDTSVPSIANIAMLTPTQAAALAKQNAPSAQLQATPELINYNGTVAYEVLLDSGTAYIDANLGVDLSPVATDNYRAEGFDDDYDDDDDDYKSEKYDDDDDDDDDDEYYKDKGRLIATNYEQYDDDKDDYDD